MKYMLLVCWDAERMNALVEPEPSDSPDEPESFPWPVSYTHLTLPTKA